MIRFTKRIEILNFNPADAPYVAVFSSTNDCINFENPVIDNIERSIFEAVVIADDEFCLRNSADISVKVTDKNGCSASLNFISSNPCDSLISEGIIKLSDTYFRILVAGGEEPYTYEWYYPSQTFNAITNDNSSYLALELKRFGTAPRDYEVGVVVTDSAGCRKEYILRTEFCKPISEPLFVTSVNCDTVDVILPITPCPNTTINWDTLEISSEADITVFRQIDGNRIIFKIGRGVPPGTYTVFWKVTDSRGRVSDDNRIEIVVPDCDDQGFEKDDDGFLLRGSCNLLNCEEVSNYPFQKTVNVEDRIVPFDFENVNWDTFEFVPNELQNVNAQGQLVTQAGVVTFSANRTYTINITNDFPNQRAIIVRYRVQDNNGNWSNVAVDSFIYNCLIDPPIANNIDFCVDCTGETVIDPTKNDNGEIDPQSIEILTQPRLGTAVVNNDGTITYKTLYKQNDATDTFKYRISNFNGDYSEEATVKVQMFCYGNAFDSIVEIDVNNQTHDLRTNVPNVAPDGEFTLLEAPNGHTLGDGGQCVLTWDEAGSINYYNQPAGDYVWQYTRGIQLCDGTFDDCYVVHVFTNTVVKL